MFNTSDSPHNVQYKVKERRHFTDLRKMRVVFALFIVVLIEAKKKRPRKPLAEDDNKPAPKIDQFPDHFNHPVPFGHIYKDGFGNLNSDLKQPFDLVELDMVRPKNLQEAKEIWRKGEKSIQVLPHNTRQMFASPRDQYWHELQQQNTTGKQADAGKNVSRTWIDWTAIQDRNVGQSRPVFKRPQGRSRHLQIPEHDSRPKKQYFESDSFDLVSNRIPLSDNRTSCDEFGKVPNFHPKDVVNIDWVPFYVWSLVTYHEAVVHRFSYPTKKLVKQYKEDYIGHLNKSIDWEQPKLMLKESVEMLLIAGDRTGMFYGIPHLDIPQAIKKKPIQFPSVMIRLKIEDPYLAIMHCDNRYAAIMAVAGNEPTTLAEKITEAAYLKFKGIGYAVERNMEAERMRAQAARDWDAQKKEDEMIKVDEPIVRDHFLGSSGLK